MGRGKYKQGQFSRGALTTGKSSGEGGRGHFPKLPPLVTHETICLPGTGRGGTVRKYLPSPPPPPHSLLSLGPRHILLEIAPAEREGDG